MKFLKCILKAIAVPIEIKLNFAQLNSIPIPEKLFALTPDFFLYNNCILGGAQEVQNLDWIAGGAGGGAGGTPADSCQYLHLKFAC